MRSEREGRGSPKGQPPNPVVAYEEIAGRAYQRYLERGATDGYDMDDWLAAEEQLRGNEPRHTAMFFFFTVVSSSFSFVYAVRCVLANSI